MGLINNSCKFLSFQCIMILITYFAWINVLSNMMIDYISNSIKNNKHIKGNKRFSELPLRNCYY